MTMDIPELKDQRWRLRHLYSCRREGDGNPIPFVPRPEQEQIFDHLIDRPHEPAYIIKSRRLGLSTGLGLFQDDSAVFNSGWRGILIDQKQDDATKKMAEILRFGIDSLPPEIKDTIRFDKRNDSELRFRVGDEDENNDSVIFATTGARGGDCSMLHISEMGPIAALDPKRAEEIVTGAFPAARLGRRVVETTWMGGRSGELWELIEPILTGNPNAEGIIYFFPWHDDPQAIRLDGMVTDEIKSYFIDLAEKTGKKFSEEQKNWYSAKKLEQRNKIYREYPSTLEEALRAPVEGAIYAEEIDALRASGKILPFPIDRSSLVHTAWDLGAPINTVTWYFQLIAGEIRVIDVDLDQSVSAVDRVANIMNKGYPMGVNLLPHDASSTPTSGRSTQDVLADAGLGNIKVIPRTSDVWIGIDACLAMFPRFAFHAENCKVGIERLDNYRFQATSSGGISKSEPVHDRNSHAADALRMIAEAMTAGLIPSGINGSRGISAGGRKVRPKVLTGYTGRR